jgi:SMC interacting uncharacterized protein involved in chromosome segregation
MKKGMTPEQMRAMEIRELKKTIEQLRVEKNQKQKIAEERAELMRLHRELNPSKLGRLTQVVGKSTELTPARKKKIVSALKSLKKAGHEFNKVRAEIRAYGQRER